MQHYYDLIVLSLGILTILCTILTYIMCTTNLKGLETLKEYSSIRYL